MATTTKSSRGFLLFEPQNLRHVRGINNYAAIIAQAHSLARPLTLREDCRAASVGAVIISASGRTYTGICLEFHCGIGTCAEHAAISEMLKAHESKIALIVAVDHNGVVLPPCGRCRELMWQLDRANAQALVVLAETVSRPLQELLPFR